MAFKFDIEPTGAVEALSPLQLAELNNELMEAHEGLTDSVKELDAVQEIMENIQTSQQLLAKHGASAIPQLNLDKGLEALCKVPENLLTAEKAVEGLGDAAKAAWQKFKDGVKQFVEWIKKIIATLITKFADLFKKLPFYKMGYQKGIQTGKEAYKKDFIASTIAKGHIVILNGVIDNDLKNLGKLVNDLCLFAENIHGENADGAKAYELKQKFDNTKIFDDLENGRFFLRSEGTPGTDSWSKCGYTDPDQIFAEIEKSQNLVTLINTLKTECIAKVEAAIANAQIAEKEDGENNAEFISDMRTVIGYARAVINFSIVLFRVGESTLSATGVTIDELKKKHNIPDQK